MKKLQTGWTMLLVALAFILLALAVQCASRMYENMTTVSLDGFTGIAFFVMNGCPHCDEMKQTGGVIPTLQADPAYKEKVKVIEKSDNVDIYKEYAHDIDGFPTMVVFKDGKMQGKFEGGRNLKSVKEKLDSL
jgi:hypothetical protein